jgi:crotonobetainyl-CoA:carnitine CoA-transferase CaiB-like acyl-CoA transferase
MPQRTGSMVPRLAPFGILPAADGHIALCAPTDTFADGVFRAIGRTDLAEDDRFRHRDARVRHADELHALIREWCRERSMADIVAAFTAEGVPAAPVREPHEAVRDPLVRDREEVVPLVHPRLGVIADVVATGVPIRFSGARTSLDRPAPALGEHNDHVYRELLGYSPETLAELADEAVI